MSLKLRVRAIDEAGAPVAGAVVRHADEQVAITDADGVAMVDGVRTGFWMVTVSHAMPAEAHLIFKLGEGSSGVIERTVTLRRGAPLRGIVMTPGGAPVPKAIVEVWSADDRTLFVESDEHGNWSVTAMQAGAYELRAGADGYERGPVVSGTHDGCSEQQGVIVRVAIGARLFGRVRDAEGQPVVGANVHVEQRPGTEQGATTDAEGRFEITGLGAGQHRVSVGSWTSTADMRDGEHRELDIELQRAEDAVDEECAAPSSTPTACVTGRVLRDGAPVSRFAVVRKGFDEHRWTTDPALIAAADGRFTMSELREASCSIHVLALGSAWTCTETIELVPGTTRDLGDIVLQRGLRIAGTVRNVDGEPISGARVTIGSTMYDDPLRDAVDGNFATTSNSDGTFAFDGVHLRDARVRIVASHSVHGASLEPLLTGSDETLELVLVPSGGIDGVIEPNSSAFVGVIVRGDVPERGSRVARVRPSGAFAVENLVPGDYALEVIEYPRGPRRAVRATVVAGQRTRVRIA